MAMNRKWAVQARLLLKAELKRRDIGYRELAERLTAAGTAESEASIANKLARGSFSAAFMLQCLSVAGCRSVEVPNAP